MAEFLETPSFPACPSFGFTGTPMFDVTKIRTAGGQEDRNSPTEQPLWSFEVTVGPREEAEIQELIEFFNALGGEETGFRAKNWADFKSCRIHQQATATDQLVATVAGSPPAYRLVKRYAVGNKYRELDIWKPVEGTIVLADAGVLKSEGADYTIDYTTGFVDLNFSPVGALTWGGEFDLPVRFDGEFPVQLVNYKIESVAFRLVQLRRP